MNLKRQVLVNAVAAAAQVIVSGAIFIVLYRFLVLNLGQDSFGIWALVVAASSTTNVANLGIANACVRFIPVSLARGEIEDASNIVQTAAITVVVSISAVVAAAVPIIEFVLPIIVDDPLLRERGLEILPIVLASFWISAVAAVFLAALEGCQRLDARSAILVASLIAYFALAVPLVSAHGLTGLALAHLGQSLLTMVASWFVLRRFIRALPPVPYRWQAGVFRRLFGYGAGLQVISVANLLTEPVAKSYVSAFGGLGSLAMYEFGSRLASQLRSVAAASVQSIAPAIAHFGETSQDAIETIYRSTHRVVFLLTVTALPLLVVILPVVSVLWIGSYEPFFVFSGTTLLLAWFANLLSSPAYYGYLGQGSTRLPVLGHLIVAVGTIVAGLALGARYGASAVVMSYAAFIAAGSLTVWQFYRMKLGLRLSSIIDRESIFVAICACVAAGVLVPLTTLPALSDHPWRLLGLQVSIFAGLMFYPLWRHPLRSTVKGWLGVLRSRSAE